MFTPSVATSPSVISPPIRPDIPRRWIRAFVEPPHACSMRIAFRKAFGVITSDGNT